MNHEDQMTSKHRARQRGPVVVVTTMALILCVPPLVQAGYELYRTGQIHLLEIFRTAPTSGGLRTFERELEDRSWLVQWARQEYARLADALLTRGNGMVIFGRDGWLFYRQAVDFVTAPALDSDRARRMVLAAQADARDPLAAIVDFHGQLQAMDIELVVVPVPVKATLYPEQLWPASLPGQTLNNPGIESFLSDLRERGIHVVDVTDDLLDLKVNGHSAYLPRDTHWTPAGMSAAAQAVVAQVVALPAYAELRAERVEFDHREVVFEGRGDIAGMLEYASSEAAFAPMTFQLRQVIATRDGRLPSSAHDSPVMLLGDSLTNVYSSDELRMGRRGGFAEHIADGLGVPVEAIASPGGGATRNRRSLALRRGSLAGKRILIWEFTQRELLFSRDGWDRVDLAAAGEDRIAAAVRSELRTVARVSAVTDTSEVPDYADCLIIVQYEHVDGDRPSEDLDTFFVAHWGWQNWEQTEAAALRPGERQTLSLVPLRNDLNLENTCWIDSVGLNELPWLAR